MKLFNHEYFDIEVELDTGHDDFIYGHYFDWDQFRSNQEEEILEYIGVSIPWDEPLTILEYANFINQKVFRSFPTIIETYKLTHLPISVEGNDASKVYIQFPSHKDPNLTGFISEIFDAHQVPSGYAQEHDLPEDLQYWRNEIAGEYNEFEYYQKFPVKFKNYIYTVCEIYDNVKKNTDGLTRKSLILSSLIIGESLLKSIISEKIPLEENISKFSKDILSTEINKQLRGKVDDRNKLFKKLFESPAPNQPWIDLRNSLAHDIEESEINNNEIKYTLKSQKLTTYSIDKLFDDQIIFCNELQRIVDRDN